MLRRSSARASGPGAALLLLAAGGLGTPLAACESPTATVNFRTGEQVFQVSSAEFELPEQLRDGATVASVPCGDGMRCPSGELVSISCEMGVCDPAPTTLSSPVGGVVDVDALSEDLRDLFQRVERIEVREIAYDVRLNTLTVDLAELELFWGPEGAIDVDSPGVTLLGFVPPIPARSTASGTVELVPAGNAALSDYLVNTDRRVRFFVRTRVDLEPGGPFPEGELTAGVDLAIRATGRIIE